MLDKKAEGKWKRKSIDVPSKKVRQPWKICILFIKAYFPKSYKGVMDLDSFFHKLIVPKSLALETVLTAQDMTEDFFS